MSQIFNQQNAILLDAPEPPAIHINDYELLSEAITSGKIHPLEPCLVTELNGAQLVLPTLTLVYHHVAQGVLGETAWMAAYCCLCNAGSVFNARVEDTIYTFAAQGYYDLMVLLADQQTQSYWNHLTGICLTGDMAGSRLKRLNALKQIRAGKAAEVYPNALLAIIAPMDTETRIVAERWNKVYRLADEPAYSQGLLDTLSLEDPRLPRHEMGLGVWTAHTQRYYPLTCLYDQGYVLVDRLDNRGLVIVFNEELGLPEVFYAEAEQVKLLSGDVVINTQTYYRKGKLYVNDQLVEVKRPPHNVIRWYGFSSIFPNCEIYSVPLKNKEPV